MAQRDLEGVQVLVVEDTDDYRELLRMALEYCGALVTTAASAEEAKRILDSIRPHVLVSDIGMPDDGTDEGPQHPGYRNYRIPESARGTPGRGIR